MDEEKEIPDENKNQASENLEESAETSQLDYESDSSATSDDAEKCPICLLSFDSQEIGRPEACPRHSFCFECILEWSKIIKTCPIDRREFAKILVFENLDATNPLRSVAISQQISLNELTDGDAEVTPCEICGSHDREDVMLLCDGCDKGYHMDCLNPPLLEIPEGNWYCIGCDRSDEEESSTEEESEMEEADADEIYDLQNEIQHEIGQLPATRLRNRQQPQILRTLQSERIRNAILARRSLRGAAQLIDIPSTSQQVSTRSSVATKITKRRKTTRRRRRRATKRVVEYEIKDGQKFPIKTTRVVRRRKRKTRKVRKARKTTSRRACGSSKGSSLAASFKNSNSNVYDLQKGRQLAGLSNFNIFEPTYQLDYVPDDEIIEDYADQAQSTSGSTLIQSVVSYTNPVRRQAMIKKRVIENFTTTSSNVNLIDSILGEQSPFDATKLMKDLAKDKIKKSTNDQPNGNSAPASNNTDQPQKDHGNQSSSSNSACTETESASNPISTSRDDKKDENVVGNESFTPTSSPIKQQKKKKSTTFDMFGDSPEEQDDDEPPSAEVCPNFSIYGNSNEEPPNADVCPNFSIYGNSNEEPPNADVCPNFSIYGSSNDQPQEQESAILNEENVDLVQMSDEGEQNITEDIEPAVVRSQPASPDLENDANEERSYTPPLVQKDENKPDRRNKKEKDHHYHHKKHKRRELERYNVRERLKDKSPRRARDRFGRNRTRTRSRSNERRYSRRRSRSHSRNRHRKSRTPDRRRKRSYTRSVSSHERRTHSDKRHKSKHKRRTRSRSATPQQKYREKSPKRRDRSTSERSKKRKRRNRSNDEQTPQHHTKEVFTSGQNILVSVNFSSNNNQDEKHSSRSKSRDDEDKDDTIVDITAKKKINVNSKPVAIIDLARSPFKELTPEYKKESNVIELSDSDGEKHQSSTAPKSPDSTKLYDPFDILSSPSNENVSSSQAATTTTLKGLNKNSIDFTNKLGPAIIKSLNLPLITNNEENLVSSSSSVNNIFEKTFPQASNSSSNSNNVINNPNSNKIEVIQSEIIQLPSNTNLDVSIESPYSPGNDYDDAPDDHEMEPTEETNKATDKASANMFDELFGSTTPPFLEKAKSSKKSSSDPDKYINKLKRQERVIEEVKLVIKPYYSRRIIDKDQYKEIMRKAVPKICHNKSGEINPTKIKHLIDSYVKFYTHKKKHREIEEVF